MISVVIPLYNKEEQIIHTLQSVLNQSYQDFEIVLVNDGSTDHSVEKVQQIKDQRVRLINQENAGVSAARNRGIEEAKGSYIAFLDADDEWNTNYLQTQHDLIEKYKECQVFATNYEFRSTLGIVTSTVLNKLPFNETDGILTNYFEVASCSHPPMWTSAVVVRKSAILKIGGFPRGIKSGEDLITWAKLAFHFKIAFTTKVLATFITSPSDTKDSKVAQRMGGEDYVLNELINLFKSENNIELKGHLKQYVLRWYKIYCVLLIESDNCHKVISLSLEAIKFGGSLKVFIPIFFVGFLPTIIAKNLLLSIRKM